MDFLKLLSAKPEVLIDPEFKVFKSEKMLYSQTSKLNRRLNRSYTPVLKKLFEHQDSDQTVLFPMICVAAKAMLLKLQD